jgi:large repetitive protein
MLESDESFHLYFDPFSTTANVLDDDGEGTIKNDDPTPSLSVSDASVAEGDDPNVPIDMLFDVALTNPASVDVTVHYSTREDTALGGGVDFRSKSGTLTFPAGTNATQQVIVKVVGDDTHQGAESFKLRLSQPLNAVIGDNEGIGTIKDGGDPIPEVSLSTPVFDVTEGDGGFPQLVALVKVSLNRPTVDTVTVNASTLNGSASAASAYAQLNNVLVTIPALSTSANVAVRPTGHTTLESDENLFLVISNPTNAFGRQLGSGGGDQERRLTHNPPLPHH